MKCKRIVAKGLRALLQPPAITQSSLHKTVRICSGTHVNFSAVERYSYIGHDGFLLNVTVGPFCSVADNCRIGGDVHPMEYVSTSPVFHVGKNVMGKNFAAHIAPKTPQTVIGADVWIGAGVIIKSGVTVGCGAVIGAGSVVTHDVPAFEIWGGNPARKIRDRFTPEIAAALQKSRWWEWSDEKLEMFAPYFNDPTALLRALEEKQA